jgi:hypothetical protein
MMDSGEILIMDGPAQSLDALPYHRALRDYLKTHESDLWRWFASTKAQEEYTEHLRVELLKAAYRLDPESHPDLFRVAEQAREQLALTIPLTLYQLQQSTELNAALYYIPGEGHVVFSGPMLSLLTTDELKSVIGHELAHYHLWHLDDGEFLIADRLLQAVANDPRATVSHHQSARWFQLYTEVFADRGSLRVTGDIQPVVSGLVKVQTGLAQVSAASYLKQAEEIFQRSKPKTGELSHPEAYIRARALSLWSEGQPQADEQIARMIEGAVALDELDLTHQVRVTALTRQLLQTFLQPKWLQTEPVLGQARLFFPDFAPARTQVEGAAATELATFTDPKLREYLCYVLLDFVVADPDLDEMPLAAALEFARGLELDGVFEKLVTKELRIKPRDLKRLKEEGPSMLAKAGVAK